MQEKIEWEEWRKKEVGQKNTMEEGKEESFLSLTCEVFDLPKINEQIYSPLVLAYIGDGVYELVIRTILVSAGNVSVNHLNSRAKKIVCAAAQSAIAYAIADMLTPEEASVYRRGRNAKSYTVAKHATMSDYRHATGLEALCGYLYLQKKEKRLLELLQNGMEKAGFLESETGIFGSSIVKK